MPISDKPQSVVTVALQITSRELTPSDIAQQLGLEPTGAYLKGAEMLSGLKELIRDADPPLRYPWHSFVLEVTRKYFKDHPLTSAKMLEVLLDELLQKIEPVAGRLHSLRDRVSAGLECAYGSRQKPEWFSLSGHLLQRISALGLSIRVLLAPLEGEE